METIHLMKWFSNEGKQGEDNDNNTMTSWETFETRLLQTNPINSNYRTFRESGLSYFI
jgi:hypothetical protein